MILTCHDCPRQLAFSGGAETRERTAAAFGWKARHPEGFLCGECAALIDDSVLQISHHSPRLDDALHERGFEVKHSGEAFLQACLTINKRRLALFGREIRAFNVIVPRSYLPVISGQCRKKHTGVINLIDEPPSIVINGAGSGVAAAVLPVVLDLNLEALGTLAELVSEFARMRERSLSLVAKDIEPILTASNNVFRGCEPRDLVLHPLCDGRKCADGGRGGLPSHLIELLKHGAARPNGRADGKQTSQKRLPTVHASKNCVPSDDPCARHNDASDRAAQKPRRQLSLPHSPFSLKSSAHPPVWRGS